MSTTDAACCCQWRYHPQPACIIAELLATVPNVKHARCLFSTISKTGFAGAVSCSAPSSTPCAHAQGEKQKIGQARLDALPVAEDGLQLGQRLQPLRLRALDQQVQVALVARVPLRRVQRHTGCWSWRSGGCVSLRRSEWLASSSKARLHAAMGTAS